MIKAILESPWWVLDLMLIGAAFLGALIWTPIFKRIAHATGFVDAPKTEAHKKHTKITPLLGGLAMFVPWILLIGGACLLVSFFGDKILGPHIMESLEPMTQTSVLYPLAFILLGAFLAVCLGLVDDWKPLSAGKKMTGQILVALIAIMLGGAKVQLFNAIPFLNEAITLFWFVLIFNAINFFDNMDGLAAGTSAISLSLFTVIGIITGQYMITAISAVSAGVALGFWLFNYNPASIFMGDSGSHFLAYILAVISVKITYVMPQTVSYMALLIPFFILALPLYDVLAVVLIRRHLGTPIYKGDNNHVSHRFVACGLSKKMAVTMVHLLSLIIGLGVIPMLWGSYLTCAILITQSVILLSLVSYIQYGARKRE